jgi:hypothetical protein
MSTASSPPAHALSTGLSTRAAGACPGDPPAADAIRGGLRFADQDMRQSIDAAVYFS